MWPEPNGTENSCSVGLMGLRIDDGCSTRPLTCTDKSRDCCPPTIIVKQRISNRSSEYANTSSLSINNLPLP